MNNEDSKDSNDTNSEEDREQIMADLLSAVAKGGAHPVGEKFADEAAGGVDDGKGDEAMLDAKIDQLSEEELEHLFVVGRFARQLGNICQSSLETCSNDQVGSKLINNNASSPAAEAGSLHPDRIGKFTILELAGRGGFANVYKAVDDDLQRHVAIKIPHLDKLRTPQLRERFHREGRAAAVLDHDGIVTAYEAGTQDDHEYICYAWVEGMDLGRWLNCQESDQSAISVGEIAAAIEHLADAIGHAHARQILHRDIKPANILVAESGDRPWYECLLVADFGLVRELDGLVNSDLTNEGELMGTPAYMSPEQVRCETAGPQSDVFALGALMYELLTGDPPHLRGNYTATLMAIENDSVAPISSVRPDVPRDLQAVCMKCLEFDPSKRYRNGGELQEDLIRFRKGDPVVARPVGTIGKLVRWRKRNPVVANLLCSTLLSLTIGLTVVGWLLSKSLSDNQRILAAQQETERFSEANRQALDSILGSFRQINPETGGKSDLLAGEVLDAASRDIESKFAAQPIAKARLLSELGRAYSSLGLYAEGALRHRKSLDLFEEAAGPLELNTIRELQLLAQAQMEAGQLSDSLDSHNQLLERAKSNLKISDAITRKSTLALAELQLRSGNFLATIDALASPRGDFEDDESLLRIELLTEAYRRNGSLKKAIHTSKSFWMFHEDNSGPLDIKTLMAKRQYVLALSNSRQINKALPLSESLLKSLIEIGGNDSTDAMEQRVLNGWLLCNLDKVSQAKQCAIEGIEFGTNRFGATHSTIIDLQRLLARCHRYENNLDLAISVLSEALALRNQQSETLSPSTWKVACDLSTYYRLQCKPKQAVKLLEPYLELFEGVDTVEAFEINKVRGELMKAFAQSGDPDAAIPLAKNRVTACENQTRYDKKSVRSARIDLIQVLLQAGEFEEVASESRKLLERWEKYKKEQKRFAKYSGRAIVQVRAMLAIASAELGDFAEAEKSARLALDDRDLYRPLNDLMNCVHASCLSSRGELRKAAKIRGRTLAAMKRSVFPTAGFNRRYLVLMAFESGLRQAEVENRPGDVERIRKCIADFRAKMFSEE
ncbi:MAG: protein kinase [Mariniblastus sp.]